MSYKRSRSPSSRNEQPRNVRGRTGHDYDHDRRRGEDYHDRDRNPPLPQHRGSYEGSWHRQVAGRNQMDFASSSYDSGCHFRSGSGASPYFDDVNSRAMPMGRWGSNHGGGHNQRLYPNPLYSGDGGGDRVHNDRHRNSPRNAYYDQDRNEGRRGRNLVGVDRGWVDPEQRRLETTSRFPNSLFLEEVDLPEEFAFRLDSTADNKLLRNTATAHREKSSYFPSFYRDNVLGATEEYIKKNNIRSYLSKREDIEPDEAPESEGHNGSQRAKTDDGNVSNASISYIAVDNTPVSVQKEKDQYADKKNAEYLLARKRESFNIGTRNNPEDVQLWRDFVSFQDEDCAGLKKKARIEKKIAILEAALRANFKNYDLHFDRLDLLNETLKASDVLMEWEKLVSANQAAEVVWLEKFKYSSTQLQLFTSSALTKEFGKGFEKLRALLRGLSVPDYKKPLKLHILVADLLFAYCLILRNAGFMEKAVAIFQSQLEFDFNFPRNHVKMLNDKSGWKAILKLYDLFWDLGTLRFGEAESVPGWSKVLETAAEVFKEKVDPIGVPDSEIVEFEDSFFEAINTSDSDSCLTHAEWKLARFEKWILIESLRSKLYWTPWRERISDVDECEDNHRVIIPKEINSFLTYVPTESYGSVFEQQATYFRHVVNFLLLLSHEFLPRTHTVESILSPFSSVALTDSSVFFSELNYWEKLTDRYYENSKASGIETIPEGYQLSEFSLPSTTSIVSPGKKLRILPKYSEIIESQKQKLLDANQKKYHTLIRNVVTQSVEHLEPKFASLLVQMLFRYEQKTMYSRDEDQKSIISFCKNLMQHDKLRSSIDAFVEIGLLDYFGGKKKKSIGFLIKTVNSSSKILQTSDVDATRFDKFFGEHWETVTQLTKLYRLLAEFHLKDSRMKAQSILVSLGNNFDPVSLPHGSDDESSSKPSATAILKAKRFFESVMDYLVPRKIHEESVLEIDVEEENNSFLKKWDGENCLEFFCQKSNLIVEWTLAYSLFAYLTEDTFDSASEVMERVMDRLEPLDPLSRSEKFSPLVVSGHNIREQLFVGWCNLGALHVTENPMQNAKFRTIFGKALEQYPSSPPLLTLYMAVESQCSVVGKLWRSMVNIVKQASPRNVCCLDWAPIFMCYGLSKKIEDIEQDSEIALDEFGIGGPAVPPDTIFYKMDALFTAAENNFLTQTCPLIWRLHLKHLAIRCREGKDSRRAHGLFYEAIRRCPTNKALYMDAIAYFPEMMTEIIEIMSQKELVVRLPMEELDLLLQFNNQSDVAAKKKEKASTLEDGEAISDGEDVIEIISD